MGSKTMMIKYTSKYNTCNKFTINISREKLGVMWSACRIPSFGFLSQDFHYKLVATLILHDVGFTPDLYTGQKSSSEFRSGM
jgi:hypothetical protein